MALRQLPSVNFSTFLFRSLIGSIGSPRAVLDLRDAANYGRISGKEECPKLTWSERPAALCGAKRALISSPILSLPRATTYCSGHHLPRSRPGLLRNARPFELPVAWSNVSNHSAIK